MSLKITPGAIDAGDGHVVLLPPGLTGTVTLEDGTVVDLGPAHEIAVEVQSLDQAKEVALEASRMAAADDTVTAVPADEFDEDQSRKNLGLTKKKGS